MDTKSLINGCGNIGQPNVTLQDTKMTIGNHPFQVFHPINEVFHSSISRLRLFRYIPKIRPYLGLDIIVFYEHERPINTCWST